MNLLKTDKTTNVKWPHQVITQKMLVKNIVILLYSPCVFSDFVEKSPPLKILKLDLQFTLTIYHISISLNAKFLERGIWTCGPALSPIHAHYLLPPTE